MTVIPVGRAVLAANLKGARGVPYERKS